MSLERLVGKKDNTSCVLKEKIAEIEASAVKHARVRRIRMDRMAGNSSIKSLKTGSQRGGSYHTIPGHILRSQTVDMRG